MVCTFFTTICDSTKNYFHREKQLHQEVEDGYQYGRISVCVFSGNVCMT